MKCEYCDGEISGSGISNGKFCCYRCKYTWHNKNRKLKPNVKYRCVVCDKTVERYIPPSAQRTKYAMMFCSRKCKGIYFSGDRHPRWLGGKIQDSDGYVYVYAKDHPEKNKDGMIFEHRLIMEKRLGRMLKKDEVIHHKNGVNNDNRISNLRLFKNQSEHMKYHDKHDPHRNASNGRYEKRGK